LSAGLTKQVRLLTGRRPTGRPHSNEYAALAELGQATSERIEAIRGYLHRIVAVGNSRRVSSGRRWRCQTAMI
jgi:hypothetical protein